MWYKGGICVAMDDNDIMEPETLAEQFIELGIDTSIEVTVY